MIGPMAHNTSQFTLGGLAVLGFSIHQHELKLGAE